MTAIPPAAVGETLAAGTTAATGVVGATAAGGATVPAAVLSRFVARAGKLYSLPAVAMKVVELTNNPQIDARALKECIEHDPALTTRILRVVNSSLFGLSGQVSDLNQALALLGTKPLKLLVLGFSLPDQLFAGLTAEQAGRYWRRTLTKAVAARELAKTLWRRDGDEAFIAGLVGDLGMLLLLQELGEPYVSFLTQVQSTAGNTLELEAAALGFDHVELTARVLEQWGLPGIIVRCVATRHQPERIAALPAHEQTLAQILHFAELLAQLLIDQTRGTLKTLLVWAQHYQRLSEPELAEFVASLQAKVDQLAHVLALHVPEGTSYADILAQAHQQLSTVASDVAADVVRVERARQRPDDEELLLEQTRSLTAAAEQFARTGKVLATPAPSPAAATRPAAEPREFPTEWEEHVAEAVNRCRQQRGALSLLVIAWDDFGSLVFHHGPTSGPKLVAQLQSLAARLDHHDAEALIVAEGRCAVILPDCDRLEAVALGDHLLQQVRQLRLAGGRTASVSIGLSTVSTPPKNFPAVDLMRAATRCLAAAQSSGGNVLKSIGIY